MSSSSFPSKKSIHVFTSDSLPFPGCPRTAGGNRSMQIISALRKAGHRVTFSMPLENFLGKKNAEKVLPQLTSEEIWSSANFSHPDVVLNRLQPDIAIHCNINTFQAVARYRREIVQIIDCYGPLQFEGLLLEASDHEAAKRDGPLLETRCRGMVEQIRQTDYLLTVSDRQKYFWSAYCTMAGFSFDELNVLVCPAAFEVPAVQRQTAPELTVVYSGGFYPWQTPDRFLFIAAALLDSIPGATLHIFGGPHTGMPNELSVRKMLDQLQQFRSVKYHGYRPIEELTATLSTAWCALELMERNIERELAITGRTVEFLSTGTPVIYNDYSSLSALITKYEAGWTVAAETAERELREIFGELLKQGPSLVNELSVNARRLAAAEFRPEQCMAPLISLCESDLQKRSKKRSALAHQNSKPSASLGRVLAISPSNGALRELRISNPLRALERQRVIAGSRNSDIWLNGLQNDQTTYDAVIVQRSIPEPIFQALHNLQIPFLLDVDDNLLARASYRAHEPLEVDLIPGLQYCRALSVPNPRLARALERYAGLPLASKTYITPNALPFPTNFGDRQLRQPSQLIWIQSDIAALSNSREAVVRAVEEFSARHSLPILLIGPNVLERPQFRHQIVAGEIDFTANLQMLEFSPTSIGIAPLETDADSQTLDFIAGKSDLKMLLFGGYGHPAVYSAATPYTDSGLQKYLPLVTNTYSDWSQALDYQFREGWKLMSEAAANIQAERHIDVVARESWSAAFAACVLETPVRGADLYRAYQEASSQEAGFGAHLPSVEAAVVEPYRRLIERLSQESAQSSAVLSKQIETLQGEIEQLQSTRSDGERLRQTIQALQNETETYHRILSAMLSSRSWKMTAPLRKLTGKLKG